MVMVLGLVALRLWWGYEAQRRLDAAIAGYRAAGQMVDAAEFDAVLDAVPDEDNAAILYEEAMRKLVRTSTSGVRYEEFNDDRSLFETKSADALELVSLNAEVISLVRQAQLRKQVAWNDRLNVDPTAVNVSRHSHQRALAQLLWFNANYRIQQGEFGEAIRYLHDLLLFSDAVMDHPEVIPFLVGLACHGIAYDSLEETIGLLSKRGAVDNVEIRKQLVRWLQASQNEDTFLSVTEISLLGSRATSYMNTEYMSYSYSVGSQGASWSVDSVIDYLGHPVLLIDTVRSMDFDTRQSRAILTPTWRSALTELRVDKIRRNILNLLSYPLTEGMLYSKPGRLEILVRLFFRRLAQRRLVVTALAVKLFEIEQGRWPGSLDELVPDYLPKIPRDPFGEIDDPIKYVVEDGRVVVYSIDVDGVDDGGEVWDRKAKKGDRTFHLVGRPEG